MSVTWVLNGSSKYEISSKEHLLQLMNEGTLYTDAGSPPATYLDGDYEQTVDIDLASDANINLIGTTSAKFTGSYDGGNFSISNWTYVGVETTVGFFGATTNAVLENVKMRGVWTATSLSTFGFFAGNVSGGTIRNIDAIFDDGTIIDDTGVTTCGGIIGLCSYGGIYAVSIGGHIESNVTSATRFGGVVGNYAGGTMSGVRNAAIWKTGIVAGSGSAGGVVGSFGTDPVMSNLVNAMVGDISGAEAGGIFGEYSVGGGDDSFDTIVNSMHGNITGSLYAGGIGGLVECDYGNFPPQNVMLYMTGDIVSTANTSGGICGNITQNSSKSFTLLNTIFAMNGSVDNIVFGLGTVNSITVTNAKIDTSFGMTYTTADYGSIADVVAGYTTSASFPELAYVPISFTDNNSTTYEYEMVFGNLSGHATYPTYTHAVLSKDDILGPYYVDFDLTANTTEYLSYMNVSGEGSVHTDGTLTILASSAGVVYDYAEVTVIFGAIPSALDLVPGPLNIMVTIDSISGAVALKLSYQDPVGSEVFVHSGSIITTKDIQSLNPETIYTIRIYVDYGTGYVLNDAVLSTTLANSAVNYTIDNFLQDGVYRMEDFQSDSADALSSIMNELFTTGNKVRITLGDNNTEKDVSFVNTGGNVSISESDALLIPFDINGSGSQSITLTLEDTSTTTVLYSATNDNITISSASYVAGDTFILDGKKVSVYEY